MNKKFKIYMLAVFACVVLIVSGCNDKKSDDKPTPDLNPITGIGVKGIYLATFNGVYSLNSNNITWKQDNQTKNNQFLKLAKTPNGNMIGATMIGGIFYRVYGDNWTQSDLSALHLPLSLPWFDFENTSIGILAAGSTGIAISSDNGSSWQSTPIPGPWVSLSPLLPDMSLLAGSVLGKGIYKFSLVPPSAVNSVDKGFFVDFDMLSDGSILAAGNGILKSIDNGTNWFPTNKMSGTIGALVTLNDHSTILAAYDNGILKSIDNGMTWVPMQGAKGSFISLAVIDNDTILAGGGVSQGLWISRDKGETWHPTVFNQGDIFSILVYK